MTVPYRPGIILNWNYGRRFRIDADYRKAYEPLAIKAGWYVSIEEVTHLKKRQPRPDDWFHFTEGGPFENEADALKTGTNWVIDHLTNSVQPNATDLQSPDTE